MRLPDFLIIGAMKCATSSLHDQLAAHPGLFMSALKEPDFFSDDEVYAKGIHWYGSLFEEAPTEALCGESSTHYSKLPTYPYTVDRIRQYVPYVQLIYVIRHPIERLISHYMHDWSERTISGSINDVALTHPGLIDYGRYAMQLQPFIKTFGFERILLVAHESIRRQPQQEIERVCSFIGYHGNVVWNYDAHASNVSSERLRKSPLRDAIVWDPVVTAVRRTLIPQSVRDRIKSLWQMKDRPRLSDDTRKRLEIVFDEDLAQLSKWIGREINCANFNDVVQQAPMDWHAETTSTSA